MASRYIGRFAPSPTGPLHFGSLVAALASYLDAKANNGKWLIRMEDLDPPREPAGAANLILDQLQQIGFDWDGDVLYQSSRLEAYAEALNAICDQGDCFYCNCTRKKLQQSAFVYDGHCRELKLAHSGHSSKESTEFAIRIKVRNSSYTFDDLVQGSCVQNLEKECGDFVIQRKDNFFAYQLAVVVDDAFQQISRVVRGYDLLDSTGRQLHIQKTLGLPTLEYAHIPTASDELGNKLSKQQFAEAVDAKDAARLLTMACRFLGLQPRESLTKAAPSDVLQWAIEHWELQNVPKLATINGTWN